MRELGETQTIVTTIQYVHDKIKSKQIINKWIFL